MDRLRHSPQQLASTLRLSTLAVVLFAAGQASAADLRADVGGLRFEPSGVSAQSSLSSIQKALRVGVDAKRSDERIAHYADVPPIAAALAEPTYAPESPLLASPVRDLTLSTSPRPLRGPPVQS